MQPKSRRAVTQSAVAAWVGSFLLSVVPSASGADVLDVSKDVWDITNNVTVKFIPVPVAVPKKPSKISRAISKLKISITNNTPDPFLGKVGYLIVVFDDKFPVGVTLKSTGGDTSDGSAYAVFGDLKPNQTRTPTFEFFGKLPHDFTPTVRVLVRERFPTPFTPEPPSAYAMGPIDFDKFNLSFKSHFSYNLSAIQTHGLEDPKEGLLKFIQADKNVKNLRWAAYMLATVYQEHRDFQPGDEDEKSYKGKDYDHRFKAPNGTQQIYYGRGYAQLTWARNYAYFGAYIKDNGLLADSDDLLNDPANANAPASAYAILSYGMRSGTISESPRGLAYYINGNKADYKGARAIVNGTDHDKEIAEYARKFEAILRASIDRKAGNPTPDSSPAPKPPAEIIVNGRVMVSAGIAFPLAARTRPTFHFKGSFTNRRTGATARIDMQVETMERYKGQIAGTRYGYGPELPLRNAVKTDIINKCMDCDTTRNISTLRDDWSFSLTVSRSDQEGIYATVSGTIIKQSVKQSVSYFDGPG